MADVFRLTCFDKSKPVARVRMTGRPDLAARRSREQKRIRMMMNAMRAEERAKLKGGEDAVAWVKEELCIGCDQCTIVFPFFYLY